MINTRTLILATMAVAATAFNPMMPVSCHDLRILAVCDDRHNGDVA